MTTDIRVRVNGDYVAKGTITIKTPSGDRPETADSTVEVSVGPGVPEAVEQSFHVPHGSTVTVELEEKHSREWAAQDEAAAGTADAE